MLTCLMLAGLVAATAVAQPSAQPDKSFKKRTTTRPRSEEAQERFQIRLRLDLTPALDSPLIVAHIFDEGVRVAPLSGNVFVTLPVRYDRDVAPQTFGKTMIHGRDARWFYGLRLLQTRDGRPRMEAFGAEPIYERIELKPADAAVHQLVARNSHGPRHDGKDKAKQERSTSPSRTLPASGWMAMVLEASESATVVRFQWANGGDEEVDLEFLRQIQTPVTGSDRLDPSASAVAACLRKLDSPSSAMAALAIRRLERLRENKRSDVPAAWLAKVDAVVVATAGRKEQEIQAAAWSYLASYERLPEATIRHISEQKATVQRRWVRIARERVEEEGRASLTTATQIQGAVLRSDDASACEAALESLLNWEPDIDWDLVPGLSERAQLLILAKLESSQDQELTNRLLTVLMKNARPATADKIASRAGQARIRLSSPVHPLLAKWGTMENARDKAALLSVLGAVDLGDVVYSRPFADLIEEATSPKANKSLREAAFQLLARHAVRSCGPAVRPKQGASESGGPRLNGRFPVLVSREARDPFLKGLILAATNGSRQTRIDAISALLAAGYAQEAEQAFRAATKDDADRNAVLAALSENPAAARSYGLSAMLGRLLCQEHASCCPAILQQMDRIAEEVPPADRWQFIAAVKAGVCFEALYKLGFSLEASQAQAAMRWMYELGHMTPQDRQRLAGSTDEDDRLAPLRQIDQRRASLVDGRYGVMAILEVLVAEQEDGEDKPSNEGAGGSAGAPRCRWSAPRLVTVVLPPLRIVSGEEGDAYNVLWGDRSIGKGVMRGPKRPGEPIRQPDAYGVKLVHPPETLLSTFGWGWTLDKSEGNEKPPKDYEQALGPAVLPTEPTAPAEELGTMTLEISEYLRAGLKTNADFATAEKGVNESIPKKCEISLQYTAFGSFHGNGPQIALSGNKARLGQRHLLNVAMILERME